MLTLLSPTPALIAAAVTVPALLLIYFLKLRRRPLRVSSTLLWEQAAKDLQVNVPFRWLRLSVVFFLQLAALAALLMALARPAIKGEAPIADRVVIVIDHSASMSARDGRTDAAAAADPGQPPSRLDEAKARAVALVRQLARGSTSTGERPSAMVVTSAASARIVQGLTPVTADLIDAINAIEPTDQPGDIAAAAELLNAARAATPEGSRRSEQIVAFTDLPAAAPADTRGLPLRLVRVAAADTPAAPPPSQTPPTRSDDNLGVVALSVRRDLERPDTVRVFARIAGATTSAVPVVVRCLFDGASAAAPKRLDLPVPPAPPTPTAASGNRAATEAGVSFEFTQRSAGMVVVSFDRPDLLDADNAAAAAIGPVTTPAVLVVAPPADGAGGQTTDPDRFLIGFVESLRPRALRVVDAAAFESEAADAASESRRPWRAFNLIIFDRTSPTPGAIPTQPTLSFGAGLPLPGLGLREPPPGRAGAVRFDTWRRTHPIMRYVALEPIIVSPAPPVIDLGAPGAAQGQLTPLAAGPDGPLIAAMAEPGAGPRRVVVSFPLVQSNWAPDTSFAIFMANAIDQLTGRGEAAVGRAFTTAEPVTVHAAPRAAQIEITGPRTLTIDVPPAEPNAPERSRPVTLGVLDRAGVYRLAGADEPAVAVNLLSERESLLGLASGPAAAGAVPPAAPPPPAGAPVPASADESGRDPDGRREIWHWFVLLAIALASVEWLVFARQVRT